MTYQRATPGTLVPIDSTWKLTAGEGGGCRPDAVLMVRSEFGGTASFDQRGLILGRPELVAEIAASTASYDLSLKREAYRANGAREYLIWRVFDEAIDWLVLRDGQYEPLTPSADGILRSEVFPGLWLNPAAMLADDKEQVARTAALGYASPEHVEFVARLRRAGARS